MKSLLLALSLFSLASFHSYAQSQRANDKIQVYVDKASEFSSLTGIKIYAKGNLRRFEDCVDVDMPEYCHPIGTNSKEEWFSIDSIKAAHELTESCENESRSNEGLKALLIIPGTIGASLLTSPVGGIIAFGGIAVSVYKEHQKANDIRDRRKSTDDSFVNGKTKVQSTDDIRNRVSNLHEELKHLSRVTLK